MTDTGHFNCRDYHISPHFAPTTLTSNNASVRQYILPRHESYDELEHRSRSPASFMPKFPLFRLPLELRQEILSYLLPKTKELLDTNPLTSHARQFSAVQKRVAKSMMLPNTSSSGSTGTVRNTSNVVWQRGNINLLSVCKQLHTECADMIYGTNTFLLFITFSGITFRYRWLISNGLAPSRSYDFIELLPERYMRLIKRVVVHVDHVDSYTGMIKFNVGGKGLTHGLRRQVQRLVNGLKQPAHDDEGSAGMVERRLTKLAIRVSNGNAVLDQVKSDIVRKREGGIKVSEDLEEMLEPFRQLYGVRDASISGAVTDKFAKGLEASMQSTERSEDGGGNVMVDAEDAGLGAPAKGVCVYGNDL